MPVIQNADALFRGSNPATRAYLGDKVVWAAPVLLSPTWLLANADHSNTYGGSLPVVETFDGRECLAMHVSGDNSWWDSRFDLAIPFGPITLSFDMYCVGGAPSSGGLGLSDPAATLMHSRPTTDVSSRVGMRLSVGTQVVVWGDLFDNGNISVATNPSQFLDQWVTVRTRIGGDGVATATVLNDQGAEIISVTRPRRDPSFNPLSLWLHIQAQDDYDDYANTDTYLSNISFRLESS